ncbi:MAG: molybdopterin biosynthesis protein MoeB [Methanocella sp. PtaU1.Bin125]|nr:MAG: molybdopterin biosynthesis protein MoeB [Methanocella sp. PtaU1.Bin125]
MIAMFFLKFTAEGLSATSYLIGSGGEAVVIDPGRDIDRYVNAARERCLAIKYILETHRHEDFVLGSTALKAQTGALICRGRNDEVLYGDARLNDGDTLEFGGMMLRALETPGHTMDGLSFALYESGHPDVALMAFSGDTLFAGSCGRIDFYGEGRKAECAGMLYRAIHEKLLPLGDQAILCPAHGAGSVCGAGISDRDETTIGYELRANPWLSYDRDTFVRNKAAEQHLYPPYFRRMEQFNSTGTPPAPAGPKPLQPPELAEALLEREHYLIDTRMPTAFAGGHIPGSLNIWARGNTVIPGWLLEADRPIYLVTGQPGDVATVARYLARIGYDRVEGYLCGGFEAWQNLGMPVDHVGAISVDALKVMRDVENIRLIDVREPHEWQKGIMPGAGMRFLGTLKDNLPDAPKDAPIAVTCNVGHRGSIGASILKNAGFTNVYNVLGGITAWKARGYPVVIPENKD